eukprot:403347812
MIERFNRFSKYESHQHLRKFVDENKFWKTMQNSMLVYDMALKQQHIDIVLCDHFLEGVFLPKPDQKIILCANALYRKKDFDNALKRMLIKMYDFNRAGESKYNPDNCKHLACSEVRAALFNSNCNIKDRKKFKQLSSNKSKDGRTVSNEFCVKDLAIEHLKEKTKCMPKAERYVDYVFEKCKNDKAPHGLDKINKLKSFNEIM